VGRAGFGGTGTVGVSRNQPRHDGVEEVHLRCRQVLERLASVVASLKGSRETWVV
jgi:hypothetical protein